MIVLRCAAQGGGQQSQIKTLKVTRSTDGNYMFTLSGNDASGANKYVTVPVRGLSMQAASVCMHGSVCQAGGRARNRTRAHSPARLNARSHPAQ